VEEDVVLALPALLAFMHPLIPRCRADYRSRSGD
jgi:hypothetical protein